MHKPYHYCLPFKPTRECWTSCATKATRICLHTTERTSMSINNLDASYCIVGTISSAVHGESYLYVGIVKLLACAETQTERMVTTDYLKYI